MIVSRIVRATAAASVAATAAVVVFVCLFFAVYDLLSGYVGPAASSAIIIAAIAVCLALGAALMLGRTKSRQEPPAEPARPLKARDRLFGLAQDRPMLAAGAAVAAGLITWRNPRLVGSLMRIFDRNDEPA